MTPARPTVVLVFLTAACSADTHGVAPPTARADAGAARADAPRGPSEDDAGGPAAEDAALDAGFTEGVDAGDPSACSPDGTCPSGAACLRGVCLDTCGARALPFGEDDLAPGLRPLWTLCPRLGEGATAAVGVRLVHAQAVTTGRVTTVSVSIHPLLPQAVPAPTPVCSVQVTADRDGVTARLDPQLALSPRGRWAHLAVALNGPPPNYLGLGTHGFLVELDTCDVRSQLHPQYRGAALVSEDPAELLLMRGPVDAAPEIYQGSVQVARGQVWLARYGADRVLASLYSGHGSMALSMLSVDALRRGPFPVEGGTSTFSAWPDRAPGVLSNGDLLEREAVVGGGDYYRHPLEGQDLLRLEYRDRTLFATKTFTAAAPAEGTRRVALVYAGGVLVVE